MEENEEEELTLNDSIYYDALPYFVKSEYEDEFEELIEEDEDENEEEQECIKTWDELPKNEQLSLTREFVELVMDIGSQSRILGLIEKAYKKKVTTLYSYPKSKCVKREVRALEYSVKQERYRKKKLLLQMKEFLAATPYGPWDFVTFTTKSLDTLQTETCLSLNDYICTKLSEDPLDGICNEKRGQFYFPDSFFTLEMNL